MGWGLEHRQEKPLPCSLDASRRAGMMGSLASKAAVYPAVPRSAGRAEHTAKPGAAACVPGAPAQNRPILLDRRQLDLMAHVLMFARYLGGSQRIEEPGRLNCTTWL